MPAQKKSEKAFRPVTVEDHVELSRRHAEKKISAVNDALKFPVGDQFEKDLAEILASDPEAAGEVVAIALTDCDEFDHINKDFSPEEGDRVLIAAGTYLKDNLPAEAKIYRIGGDEFGIIFRGSMEREEIFLLLNDLKNNYSVTTPDGVRQSITVGMATAFVDASRCAELIRKADSALYRAKVSGRKRWFPKPAITPRTSSSAWPSSRKKKASAKRSCSGKRWICC